MSSPSQAQGLAARVARVTGGSSGIGATTVRELVAHGARVMIAGIEDEAGAGMAADYGLTAYAASKGAAINYSRALAIIPVDGGLTAWTGQPDVARLLGPG